MQRLEQDKLNDAWPTDREKKIRLHIDIPNLSLHVTVYKKAIYWINLKDTNICTEYRHMDRNKRIWYLSPMRAAKVQASLCIRAVSPEPSLLAHTSSESRGTFIQKARSLAPLNGWACAVKICHDAMLEDTNSLDGAQILFWYILKSFDIHCFVRFFCDLNSHVQRSEWVQCAAWKTDFGQIRNINCSLSWGSCKCSKLCAITQLESPALITYIGFQYVRRRKWEH